VVVAGMKLCGNAIADHIVAFQIMHLFHLTGDHETIVTVILLEPLFHQKAAECLASGYVPVPSDRWFIYQQVQANQQGSNNEQAYSE